MVTNSPGVAPFRSGMQLMENCWLIYKGSETVASPAQFSPDGKKIVTASVDATAKVWDVATGNLLAHLKGHTSIVNLAQYQP